MALVQAAFSTSHASGLMDPGEWDPFRAKIRSIYAEWYGEAPPEPDQVAQETAEGNAVRHERIGRVHDLIRRRLRELKPDAVIVLGNDQNENFNDRALPQFAVFTGDEMTVEDHLSNTTHHRSSHPGLAKSILEGLVSRGFDVVQASKFEDGKLRAHAHAQVMASLVEDRDVPVIPIFVNAISPPLSPVGRCFAFGRALGEALGDADRDLRVVIATSGGLSHFTAGFPYKLLSRPRIMGTICEEFDREILSWIEAGDLERIGTLTDQALLDHGDVEFRQSIAFFGALPASTRPTALAYEAIYRSLIGMWAGYWDLSGDDAPVTSTSTREHEFN